VGGMSVGRELKSLPAGRQVERVDKVKGRSRKEEVGSRKSSIWLIYNI